MLGAVALQVIGAVILKLLADNFDEWTTALVLLGVAGVILVNVARLGVWGLAHSRFPLSTTFPLSSLFYPAMLVLAVLFGDQVGMTQVGGAALIAAGTFWLTARVSV
jgi:multidrug transporter EmrE-like cation transporter